MSLFQKAERKKAKLKLALTGPSGAGKTMSALRLAKGLGGKIALIDTENGSASLYADKFDFDTIELSPPFTTEKYIQAIQAAQKAGYDILIIDQISHAWSGPGGLLEQKEVLDARPGSNHWTNWGPITKKHEAFKAAWLHSPLHVIATMRSKQDYAQVEENGKKKIQKLGMAPVQREGVEYEFTVVFDAAMDHKVQASKDRTDMFGDEIFQVTEETGQKLNKWLNSGKDVPPPKQPAPVQQKATPPHTPPVMPKDPRDMVVSWGDFKNQTIGELYDAMGALGLDDFISATRREAERRKVNISPTGVVGRTLQCAQEVIDLYAGPPPEPPFDSDSVEEMDAYIDDHVHPISEEPDENYATDHNAVFQNDPPAALDQNLKANPSPEGFLADPSGGGVPLDTKVKETIDEAKKKEPPVAPPVKLADHVLQKKLLKATDTAKWNLKTLQDYCKVKFSRDYNNLTEYQAHQVIGHLQQVAGIQ